MGRTRDLFKKIRDTKGIFHAKMGTIKDKNGKELIEAEDIKKRWQEYTEELYKKGLTDLDNHNGMVTHLETDIFIFLFSFSVPLLCVLVLTFSLVSSNLLLIPFIIAFFISAIVSLSFAIF